MNKNILYTWLLLLGVLASTLAMSSCAGTEKAEAITAEITAAQMQGRNAARYIIHRQWKDTTGFGKEINKVYIMREEYYKEHQQECAEAFDSTFVRTVRAVRPDLMLLVEHSILYR